MYYKLKNFGRSVLWLFGFAILMAQTYRIVMFYIFDKPLDVELARDGFLACLGVAFMFVQAPVKNLAKRVLSNINPVKTNKNGN